MSSNLIPLKGTLIVSSPDRITVETDNDILHYYRWFIRKEHWIDLQLPLYGAHVTVASKKFHKFDYRKALKFNNKPINFLLDPDLVRGGITKGFIMFYAKVFSQEIEDIKSFLNIREANNYRGLHLTICNGKSGAVKPYWPNLITIKNHAITT